MRINSILIVLLFSLTSTGLHAAFAGNSMKKSLMLTIQSTGLNASELETLWGVELCNPNQKMDVKSDVPKRVPLTRSLVKNEFLAVKPSSKAGHVSLVLGSRCKQLNNYYFKGISDPSGDLAEFFKLDETFKEKYGFSVIDGVFALKSNVYTTNAVKHDPYKLQKMEQMQENGLVSLTTNETTFNGQASTNYTATLTDRGRRFAEQLRQ